MVEEYFPSNHIFRIPSKQSFFLFSVTLRGLILTFSRNLSRPERPKVAKDEVKSRPGKTSLGMFISCFYLNWFFFTPLCLVFLYFFVLSLAAFSALSQLELEVGPGVLRYRLNWHVQFEGGLHSGQGSLNVKERCHWMKPLYVFLLCCLDALIPPISLESRWVFFAKIWLKLSVLSSIEGEKMGWPGLTRKIKWKEKGSGGISPPCHKNWPTTSAGWY